MDEANAGDVGVVPADQAPYPPRQVWAAARALASAVDQIDLDRAEDEIRASYYGTAEDALIAARDAVLDAAPVLQEETGTRELIRQLLVEVEAVITGCGPLDAQQTDGFIDSILAAASLPSGDAPTELERRLRRSLEKWGRHTDGCSAATLQGATRSRCACGYHDALTQLPLPSGDGERQIVVRFGADDSLPRLIEGVPSGRTQLVANDDGTYTIQLEQRLKDMRAAGRKPAAEFLIEGFNAFIEEIEDADMPARAEEALARFVDRWNDYNGGTAVTPADAFAVPPAPPSGETGGRDATFKCAAFSGPHPSLTVDCPTCGSPAGHYCNDDDGNPADRPHDARKAVTAAPPAGETGPPACATCGGRGWHTAGCNDPSACSCAAGAAWAIGETGDNEYESARGALPWREGDELPEDVIRRGRGETGDGRGVELIATERRRQVEREGYVAEHDDEHADGELAHAAAAYAWTLGGVLTDGRMLHRRTMWPFEPESFKPAEGGMGDRILHRIHELAKAGALVAAEIDRLERLREIPSDGDQYGRHFSEEAERIRKLPPADRRAVDNRREISSEGTER